MKEISKLSIEERNEWENEDIAKRTIICREPDLSESLKRLSSLLISEGR